MAKAIYTKGQRVWVKAVGAWASVEKIIPQWVRGVEEPIRVTYDVGLGREFQGSELIPEAKDDPALKIEGERWRLLRMRNRMTLEHNDQRHPFPGTFPVVVTDELDWGGWRVPAAEYERDPERIEFQARVIASGPLMLAALKRFLDYADAVDSPDPLLHEALAPARAAYTAVFGHDGNPERSFVSPGL